MTIKNLMIMSEVRFFYVPEAATKTELPEDEAMHALRVLRLRSGDEMRLMDGEGVYYKAVVDIAATRRCSYKILETYPQEPLWKGKMNIVMAPTKSMDKIEWMAEKATEIGINSFSFINCKQSERKVLRTVRLDKIVVAAVKQSHKPWKPAVRQMETFKQFISTPRPGRKFICHCVSGFDDKFLFDCLRTPEIAPDEDIWVLIGPEGDFTQEEVEQAIAEGFQPVTLGPSRLRTETAALYAVTMFQLAQK